MLVFLLLSFSIFLLLLLRLLLLLLYYFILADWRLPFCFAGFFLFFGSLELGLRKFGWLFTW